MNLAPFFRKLARLLRRQGVAPVIAASAVGVASGLANAGAIALIHHAIQSGQPPSLAHFWVFAALCVSVPITRVWSQYLLLKRCLQTTVDLVLELTSRAIETPLRRLEEIGPARILTALTQDVPALTDGVVAVPTLLVNGAALAGCVAYLAWLQPIGAAVFVAVIVFATASMLFIVRRSAGIQKRARTQADRLFEHFRAHLAGIKELQLHGRRRADFQADVRRTAEAYRRLHTIVTLIYTTTSTGFHLLFLLPVGVLVFVVTHAFGIPVAEVSAYALVLLYMMAPVSALSGIGQTLGRGAIALDHIDALGLALQPASAAAPAATAVTGRSWRSLELTDVMHGYAVGGGATPFVLGPLRLRFDRGDIVFLTGGNGSGKTTLAKLLCGLYIPDRGSVCLDGTPIGAVSRDAYRQHFSAVFGDFHLFKRLLGFRDVDALAREQLKSLGLGSTVDVRDGEFTTLNLSQGQRKRLALLVAALEDRDIYVFDEWAADQDHGFRERFYRAILPALRARGKTVFVISHDERYYDIADRVLTLELGQVVADTAVDADAAPAVTL